MDQDPDRATLPGMDALVTGVPSSGGSRLERASGAPASGGRGAGGATPTGPVAGTLQPSPDPDPGAGVVSVVLDVPLAHLDRPFDYAVPAGMAEAAVPGVRVAVRFAGREVQGFVVDRRERSEHPGPLSPLRRVVSPLPVLAPEVIALARAVAARYAGTLSDVLRLAVPPRHARAEKSVQTSEEDAAAEPGESGEGAPTDRWVAPWASYRGGPALIRRLAAGEAPRAVWAALPGAGSWADAVATATAATLAGGRGVLVVVPDARDVARVGEAFDAAGVPHVRLLAEDGSAARYRAFLRVLLGRVRVVIGTRSAAFAPVANLGLVVCWDDGDDLLVEPRAPYPHALDVLVLRAGQAGAGALIGGFARSAAAQLLLEDGWARPVEAPRSTVRAATPRVGALRAVDLAREGPAAVARIPHPAWELARRSLADGPVLVQVPRAGYVPVTACATCRTPARCTQCTGPLRLARAGGVPTCAWCARPAVDWACPSCTSRALRAVRVGSERTAEELGRAFPGTPVVVSGAGAAHGVTDRLDGAPRVVVATPGAEPVAAGGYVAALLLDAHVTSGRPELWAAEESLRRWLNAAALVRPAPDGGRVLLLGDGAPIPSQALVRWDPQGFAARELAERADLALPPAAAMASIEGPAGAVASFLAHLGAPAGVDVLGPVPVEVAQSGPRGGGVDDAVVRALLRTERTGRDSLARSLAGAAAARSARKEPGAVRVRMDPTDLW